MVAVTVDRIELLAIGPDGEKVTWSSHLGPMHQALVVARLFLSNGVEAIAGTTTYTEHEFDRTVFSAASLMAPFVLGRDAFDIRAAYADMRKRYVPLGHVATSLFDIALHDGKAKTSGQPIYRMLGASRDEIRAYASSPLLRTNQALRRLLSADVRARLIAQSRYIPIAYSTPTCVWSELSSKRSPKEALVGVWMSTECTRSIRHFVWDVSWSEAGWEFMEAPLPDADLRGYKALAEALDLDVICGGNSLPIPQLIEFALQMGAWDRSRFDVTGIGGFTGAGEVVAASQAHGKTCEVQSWGYTLTQAANLHLMLAHSICRAFEQATPVEIYEFGAKQVIRPDADGFVRPSACPGWGSRWTGTVSSPASTRGAHFQHDRHH